MLGLSTTAASDTLLDILIDGAEAYAEQVLGVKFTSTTRTDELNGGGHSLIPFSLPITAISKITDQISEAELDSDTFRQLDNQILFGTSGWNRWLQGRGRYKVEYTGGYDGAVTAPAGLKLSVLELSVRGYHNRSGLSSQSSQGVSTNWETIAASDIGAKLLNFSLTSPF